MKHYIAIIAVMLLFMAGIYIEAQDVSQTVKGFKVTILIYSGRPNPTFTVTDKNMIEKIESFFKNTPKDKVLKGETVSPNILGYNGILVENLSDKMPDTDFFLVYNANVEVKNKKSADKSMINEMLSDNTLELQKMLIAEAQKQGVIDQKVIDYIDKTNIEEKKVE